MKFKDKKYTTSYKYFSNDTISFVTSAKVGSRFMKSVSDELEFSNYDNPISQKLKESKFNDLKITERNIFINYVYDNFFKGKETVFLIRNPIDRMISGLTTNLTIIQDRLVRSAKIWEMTSFLNNENIHQFLTHYFDEDISNDNLQIGVAQIKHLIKSFLETKDSDYLKKFIIEYVLPQSIYKDAHVEFHHFMAYNYMNDLKEYGVNLKYLNITDLDSYFKSKELVDWGYNEKMNLYKQTEKNNIFYKYLAEKIQTWKSEIKELSLYLETEIEYYYKIQSEYEILL